MSKVLAGEDVRDQTQFDISRARRKYLDKEQKKSRKEEMKRQKLIADKRRLQKQLEQRKY